METTNKTFWLVIKRVVEVPDDIKVINIYHFFQELIDILGETARS